MLLLSYIIQLKVCQTYLLKGPSFSFWAAFLSHYQWDLHPRNSRFCSTLSDLSSEIIFCSQYKIMNEDSLAFSLSKKLTADTVYIFQQIQCSLVLWFRLFQIFLWTTYIIAPCTKSNLKSLIRYLTNIKQWKFQEGFNNFLQSLLH